MFTCACGTGYVVVLQSYQVSAHYSFMLDTQSVKICPKCGVDLYQYFIIRNPIYAIPKISVEGLNPKLDAIFIGINPNVYLGN